MITLFQIQTFCEVVENGTFRAAADKLYISQPSVSQHIANLEKHLSVRLFDRKKKKVRLTPEGRIFYTTAKEVLKQLDEVKNRINELRSLEAGTLKIGCSTYVDSLLLSNILPEFAVRYPGVSISTIMGNNRELVKLLQSSEIELLLVERTRDFLPQNEMSSKVIATEKLAFVASYEIAHSKDLLFPKDLENYPFIGWHQSSCLSSYLSDFEVQNQLHLKHKIIVSSIETARELAIKGLGVALLNLRTVQEDIRNGSLCKLEVKCSYPLELDILALFHQTQGLTYAGWEMLKFLEEKLI